MALCSIIIPVHDRLSVVRQCLRALFDDPSNVADTEIIVVDAGSVESTARALDEFADRIRIVGIGVTGSRAIPRNRGASLATGTSLVFLEPEMVPHPGWLTALIRCADANPAAGVVGSKILRYDDTILHAGIAVGQDHTPHPIYAGFPKDHPAVNRTRSFQMVTGGSLFVRREAFDEVSGFDAAFVNAYDDHDLCLRLSARGYDVYYCHDSVGHRIGDPRPPQGRLVAADADRTLFRIRWGTRMAPNDLSYYVQDGLLRLTYPETYPLRVDVSPLLATVAQENFDLQAARLLAARTSQVATLYRENARLASCVPQGATPDRDGGQALELLEPTDSIDDTAKLPSDSSVDLVPPTALANLVGGKFQETGEEFFQYFTELGGLKPTDRVLDVGCGSGRMAVRLAPFLANGGAYEGFDVVPGSIAWCEEHVTPRYPHLRFRHADLSNSFYNPDGSLRPSEYRFPFPEASFDFVILTSVFTHLLPGEVQHYLAQVATRLKKGGTCFSTLFLLNDESLALMRAGLSPVFHFRHRRNGYRTLDPQMPETGVAYDEHWIRDVYRAAGLRIVEPIRYGNWCSRLDGLSLQDIVVAVRE